MVAATPSGITLAPEGGAHQSIATPLIGIAQDGLASFEPAFVDELAVIMGWGFRHMQREGRGRGPVSVYLRLSTRTIEQPQRIMTPDLRNGITDGALLDAQAGAECRSRDRLYRRGGAGGDRGHRPDRREPPRCRPARDHIGRPVACGVDWARAKLRRDRRGIQHLSHIEKLLAPLPRDLRHRHRDPTAIRRRSAGSAACAATASRRSASSIFGQDRHHRRPLPPLRHGRQRHHRRGGESDRGRPGTASQDGGVIPAVAPANAGAHTPRRLLFRTVADDLFQAAGIGGYGSPAFAGPTK